MALDLTQYFRLGTTTEDMPLTEDLYITMRTAPETKSKSLNRVIFKVPEIGLLTNDSQIVLTPVADPAIAGRVLNPVNGILGCIRKTTLTMDGKTVSFLEYPGLADVNDMYSRHSTAQLLDYDQFMHGSGMGVNIKMKDDFPAQNRKGLESMLSGLPLDESIDTPTLGEPHINKYRIGTSRLASRKYAIKLRDLGIHLLELNNLPMYLMKGKTMQIEIEFLDDCREWVSGVAVGAGDVVIDLDSVELVTSHIMVPKNIEQEGILMLQNQPQLFKFIDRYMIPASLSTKALGAKVNEVYRLNLQGRELHKLLMVFRETHNSYTANQTSICLGDEELQLRVNGTNLYDRPLTNPSLIYYQNQLYNDGRALQVSLQQYMANSYTNGLNLSDSTYHAATRGKMHFIGVDFTNGNMIVDKSGQMVSLPYGGGVPQKTSLEIDYSVTPRRVTTPVQENQNLEVYMYVSVAKTLLVGKQSVEVTF